MDRYNTTVPLRLGGERCIASPVRRTTIVGTPMLGGIEGSHFRDSRMGIAV
jgi:hypothetical protein